MNIVIPMAGRGERFKSANVTCSKPMIKPFGKETLAELSTLSLGLNGKFIFIINNENEDHKELRKILEGLVVDPIIIEIDYITNGPAATALLARHYIDNEESLLIANCDQIMEWDASLFSFIIDRNDLNVDGIVVTYDCDSPKNSYVELDENFEAIRFAEKEVISKYSLNGIHWWKHGRNFVSSAKKMIEKNIRVNGEFYISMTYNQLIEEGATIMTYNIPKNQHWAVGTPEDLLKYVNHVNRKSNLINLMNSEEYNYSHMTGNYEL